MPSYCTSTRANADRRALARYCPRPFNCNRRPSAPLKFPELLFQLPLQARLFAAGKKILTRCSWCGGGLETCTFLGWNERLAVAPQTVALDEGMLQAGARHALQFAVRQVLLLDALEVFVRHVRPRHAFVVGSQRNRHASPHEIMQGMMFAPNPEDDIVTGQTNLDHRSEERRVGKECRSRWS